MGLNHAKINISRALNEFKNGKAAILKTKLLNFFSYQHEQENNCYFANVEIYNDYNSNNFFAWNALIIEDELFYIQNENLISKKFNERTMRMMSRSKILIPKNSSPKLVEKWFEYMKDTYYFAYFDYCKEIPLSLLLD